MEISKDYAVQMRGITKVFGDFCALDQVELNIRKGSIHALLGENGAGKSTLMNVLYGLYQAEEGEIYLYGEKVAIKNPSVAIDNGIGMVHQHFMLVDNFTVEQNIILGSEPKKAGFIVDMDKARTEIEKLIQKYGLSVNLDALVADISVGMQQRVEILKALYRGVDILILDEPTAVLTPQEIEELKSIMKNLIQYGKTIIIITHKLTEIRETAEKCTIIRRGKYIDTVDVAQTDETGLATMMVGHPVKLVVDKTEANPGEVVLEIERLVVKDQRGIRKVNDLNLKVRKGEIVGIAGIDGNGQKELVEAIASYIKSESGQIKVNGKEVQNTRPQNVLESGISIIHEDRHQRGLVLPFSVAENAVLETYRKAPFQKHGFLQKEAMRQFAEQVIKDYDVRPSNCENQPVKDLSGGNQQKVIIAREVANNPDVLIAVQPTRGLDVGAIEYVHKVLVRERDRGKAILLISYELDEIMNVSDTIAVIYDGHINASFKQGEVDQEKIGLLMAGGGVQQDEFGN